MNSYNKADLDIIAHEHGFIRDNLEKVMRLVEILDYLRRTEKFDFEEAKRIVIDYLDELLQFSQEERQYMEAFEQRTYHPEWLFEDPETVQRVSQHPMALWKMGKK